MDTVREYLLSVTTVALCCGILTSILENRGMCGSTVKFLCGVAMLIALVSPLMHVRLDSLGEYFTDLSADAASVAELGKEYALKESADIIKERTAAYILDKANSLGAELTVEVTLCDTEPPVPCAVSLEGTITPYGKKILSDIISRELGIKTEDQTWIG